MENSVIIPCTCGHVIMEVYRDEQEYCILFYHYRFSSNLLSRLKTAWKYLIKGERILIEDIVLTQEDMDKLSNFVKQQ